MAQPDPQIDTIRIRLAAYHSEYQVAPAKWALRCCELALQALEAGNYGVGAVLVDADNNCLAESGNQVFGQGLGLDLGQGFDSAGHAEMRVLDQFEREYSGYGDRSGLTLYTSLEPCLMCSGRILAAGIGRVVYLAADPDGGMMSHSSKMPPAWRNLYQLIDVHEFSLEKELSELAADIASAQIDKLRRKFISTVRP